MKMTGVAHIIEIFACVTLLTSITCFPMVTHNGTHLVTSTEANISIMPNPTAIKQIPTDHSINPTLTPNPNPLVIAPTGPSENRPKREIIFRPLFVYREQQIEKQRINNARQKATDEAAARNSYYARYPPQTQYYDPSRETRYSDYSLRSTYNPLDDSNFY
ncbi:uncharacterized protein LOC131689318 [Topomyia yanbarensis]|uniref:uncharacterized protein LOC131689318 n=1 Tax=Topomyia yanbarensis TaxID=2498891 RepID=UPI00273B108D|nr:uncharacterized protein LOC131689318 [Topomyia yanbarensis]